MTSARMPVRIVATLVLALVLVALLPAVEAGAQKPVNHLAGAQSPYLRMHVNDPVDWYPWSPEALAKARRENKPIFLSIGYSTCHWCHVMQAESFSDPGIAELLNQNFVPIKVDREERPDLDRVYMAYLVSVSGGGWPANVFLTPDLHPFYGASYMPPDDRDGQAGLRPVLTGLSTMWVADRDTLLKASKESRSLIEGRANGVAPAKGSVDRSALDATYTAMRRSYDTRWGGFGGAPKFPRPVALTFLLRHYARTGARPALDQTLGTLRGMARGGIRDHIGGGFHRYTTDAAWRVPHFEKMLYDQAQLALAYVDGFQVSRDVFFRDVARETLDYVLRDLRDAGGAFQSAEDADSLTGAGAHAEGAYYVWTADEVHRVVGADAFDLVAARFGIEAPGNVPKTLDIQGELAGQNVLHLALTETEAARRLRLTVPEARRRLRAAVTVLRTARATRARPARDDKVLVAWNGLMISALARAAQVFDEPRYLEAAGAAARFIERTMYSPSGGLKRRYRAGDVDIDAFAEDYACLIAGLLDLYEASFDVRWLTWAVALQERQDRLFWDTSAGGYFSTTASAADVVARFKDDYDGAEPSANSVSAMNLLRLWQVTGRKDWRAKADALFRALSPQLIRAGSSVPHLAAALDFGLSKPKQVVIAGQKGAPDTRALLRLVHQRFLPTKVVLLADGGEGQKQLATWLPTLAPMKRLGGKATLYLCENYVCRLPTADLLVAAVLLDGKDPETVRTGSAGSPSR